MTFPHGIDLTTDWHCHLLPGLDDGPATLAESLEMARMLATAGVRTVHCTPHFIKGSYEYTPDEVKQAVADLQSGINSHGIQLELRQGMEYMLDEYFTEQLKKPLPLGDSELLLVEASPTLPISLLKEHIFSIVRCGLKPLLAHPERNFQLGTTEPSATFWPRRKRAHNPGSPLNKHVIELQQMGCLFQANLGSFCGYYGAQVKKQAEKFRLQDLYHAFGSDAHSLTQCRTLLS